MKRSISWGSIRLVLALCCIAAGGVLIPGAPALAGGGIAFTGSFGGLGSGNGKLKEPKGVAVNETSGDVYVVDKGNNRVEYFSSTGIYIGQFNGSAAATGAFSEPSAIAVDNTCVAGAPGCSDPSGGDVYVVDAGHGVIDKFSATGTYLGQLTEAGPTHLVGAARAIALDPRGNLWVSAGEGSPHGVIDEFNNAVGNQYLSRLGTIEPLGPGIAVYSKGGLRDHIYFLTASDNLYREEEGVFHPFFIGPECNCSTGLALDESAGDLYVDETTQVAQYSHQGELVHKFGAGELTAGAGVAINAASRAGYVADSSADVVRIFSSPVLPTVEGGCEPLLVAPPKQCGQVNPHGVAVSACNFEIGTQKGIYTNTYVCQPEKPLTGEEPIDVTTTPGGLEPDTSYFLRISATNANGTSYGPVEEFTTSPIPPSVVSESVSAIAEGSAKLEAQIRAGGEATYYFEYGTGACEASGCGTKTAPEGGPLTGDAEEAVSVVVTTLKPNTTYHYWVVAKNAASPGGIHGEAKEFTTPKSTEEIRNEEAEREVKLRAEAEAKAKAEAEAQAAAAAKKHQEEEAAATKKRQEEAAAAAKKKREEEAASDAVSVAIVKIKVGPSGVTITLQASRKGTVIISGQGLKRSTTGVAAGENRIKAAFTKAGEHDRKRHRKIKITIELKAAGKTVSVSKTVKL